MSHTRVRRISFLSLSLSLSHRRQCVFLLEFLSVKKCYLDHHQGSSLIAQSGFILFTMPVVMVNKRLKITVLKNQQVIKL